MKTTAFVIAFLMAAQLTPSNAFGDEMQGGFTKTDFGESVAVGRNVYHHVAIKSVTDGVVVISSKEGDIKVTWASLPIDFQRKHAADKVKIEAQTKDAALGVKELHIEINQVVAGGVLADPLEEKFTEVVGNSLGNGGSTSGGGKYYERSWKIIFVQGVNGAAEGKQLTIKAYPDKTFTYRDTRGASRTVEKWVLAP